ncbi:MAG TPA: hypothetical protein VLC92_01120 [Rhodocyclaceae bacterium]|nr:hypothetical protein [Rhodocyclaceae bacterium]
MQILERLEEKIDRVTQAFPGGDPEGHRKYHDAVIKRLEARTAFFEKLLYELVKYGVIGFCGWAFVAGWTALLKGPK